MTDTDTVKPDRFANARAAKAAKAAAAKGENGATCGKSNASPTPPIADDWGMVPGGSPVAADGDGWGIVDLGGQRSELPAPGWHAATISDIKITGTGGLVLWCAISYSLTGTPALVQEMEPIAAKPTAAADKRQRLERGNIMLGRVQRATGADLTGVKRTDIGERLIGKSCFVLVSHGEQYGVPVLNLRGVSDQPR